MKISEDTVAEFEEFVLGNAETITRLVNFSRENLGEIFDEDVPSVSEEEVLAEFESVEDEDLVLNLAALYKLGVELEVKNDYAGFVVDELIGREIAGSLAGYDPEETLAEATFHYIDIHTGELMDGDEEKAGYDDVLAGIAAGLQCRLGGWDWQEN